MLEKYTYHFQCMTTPCELQIYAASKGEALQLSQRIEANTRRLETKYNFFSSTSLLSRFNQRNQQHTSFDIDEETQAVLLQVRELSQQTAHHFDITVGTLKACLKHKTVAEVEACRRQLLPLIGEKSWQVKAGQLHFFNSQVKLDLGGVIKEYAVDQAAHLVRQVGLSALINFGGDIYVVGNKPDGSAFNIAIKNPKDPSQSIAVLQLADQGLTTSAHYERSTRVEGTEYSHIIGEQSSAIEILSATVVSGSVLSSGVWSTAMMLQPSLRLPDDISVVLIDEQLRLHQNIA